MTMNKLKNFYKRDKKDEKNLRVFGILPIILFIFTNCGVSTKNLIYHEPSIQRQEISVTRIAIVPNRLPLNLTDPEKWRHYNWEVASKYLQKQGYDVIDYQTSIEAFDKSGLRMEDTKSSRDKYADLAERLSVDVIFSNIYSMISMIDVISFSSTNICLII